MTRITCLSVCLSISSSYTYFTLYGRSLTTRDVKDSQMEIVLPIDSSPQAEVPSNTTTASSNDKKRAKSQGQSKKVHRSKADIIREENTQRKLAKSMDDEAEQLVNVEDLLQTILPNDHPKMIETISECLLKFKTPTNRLELLKRKFRSQRKLLQSLKKKPVLSAEELVNLNLLQINYFATMTEMTHHEHVIDAFDEKKKYMEELTGQSPVGPESWYRFQMEKVNSRLPRRELGVPDPRAAEFIPDQWQVEFLNAVDRRQSIIIVAPTASGQLISFNRDASIQSSRKP
jgi:superfamily II RNA helicase